MEPAVSPSDPKATRTQVSLPTITYTKRFSMVKPEASDDEEMAKMRCHPTVRCHLPFLPAEFSTEDAAQMRRDRESAPDTYCFNVHGNHLNGLPTYAGGVMLKEIDKEHRSCEAGIIIAPAYHRMGVATDALYFLLTFGFEELGMHRINFITAEKNEGMRKWLQNVLKAEFEGTRRECWTDGKGGFINAVEYSVLEDEWVEASKLSLGKKMDSYL